MSATKLRNLFGVLLKAPESTYGTALAVSNSTDGLLVTDLPEVDLQYANDGARNGSGPGFGGLKRVGKSGRFGTVTLSHEAHGYGAAYTASNKPSVHAAMLAAGFDAAVTTTSGAEKWVYSIATGSFASATAEVYANGHKDVLSGAYADLSIGGELGAIPKWDFALSGIAAQRTDSAPPAITYPSTLPPKAESMAIAIGDFSPARVKEFSYKLGRPVGARAYDNTNARHGGFSPGRPVPMLEIVVEAVAFAGSPYHAASTLDPYMLGEAGNAVALALTVGSTQYNRWKINAGQAQLAEDPDIVEDGPNALWRLNFWLPGTTPTAVDGHTLTFD